MILFQGLNENLLQIVRDRPCASSTQVKVRAQKTNVSKQSFYHLFLIDLHFFDSVHDGNVDDPFAGSSNAAYLRRESDAK